VYVGSISESFVPIYILILPMYDCTWIHKPPVTSLKSILFQKLFWSSTLNLQNSITRTFFFLKVQNFFSKKINNTKILKHVTCYSNSKPEKNIFLTIYTMVEKSTTDLIDWYTINQLNGCIHTIANNLSPILNW
jgi:hypothetical protein